MTHITVDLTDETRAELDADIAALTAGAEHWAGLTLRQRADLFDQVHDAVAAHAQTWAEVAVAAKRTPAAYAGEESLAGPYAAMNAFAGVARSLRLLAEGKSPIDGLPTGTGPGGRTTVKILPSDAQEVVLFSGFSASVWLEPGVSVDQARAEAGLGARRTGENGGVGVVLGAGNVSSIGPLDVLYELVSANRTSVLKLNPTFATLKPVLDMAFAPLVGAGLMRVVNGGAAVGGYLTGHDGISHVHITGSGLTHDAIVWGTGEEARTRRAAGDPKLTKEITSELGGVSPIIVVPGEWSKADLRYQAEHVATQRLQNAGHNCIAGQALILSSDWPQRDAFLDELRAVLDELPPRPAWYPGSEAKLEQATTSYPEAEIHTSGRLLVEVTDETSQDLFTTEYFAPVLGHTTLPGAGADFLANAVEFANERLDGSLGAAIIADPKTLRGMGARLQDLLASLRYGVIGVNAWTAVGFLLHGATWGAFPGNTLDEVGSGIGIVHNSHLLAHAERTVVTGPFRPFPRSVLGGELSLSPKAPWFLSSKTANTTAARLTAFAGKSSWARIPGIVASALRG
ncbi:MAG: aldehyde dehydrogenase family protein [Nocardioides sp.]|uniref:aldehyde dehydrogenase family protein n=1 Tax=Nocardioides sp. TaxID=35761 RepID=UPI0039E63FF9